MRWMTFVGQRVKERITVLKNGEENKFLTENWSMFVENILPSALSNFFFFVRIFDRFQGFSKTG